MKQKSKRGPLVFEKFQKKFPKNQGGYLAVKWLIAHNKTLYPYLLIKKLWTCLRSTIFKEGVKIRSKSRTFMSPLRVLLHEDVQILLFWNNSVDVPAFISCWKNILHETLIIRCFRSSLKKYAHTLSSNFLLSPLLKCFWKENLPHKTKFVHVFIAKFCAS